MKKCINCKNKDFSKISGGYYSYLIDICNRKCKINKFTGQTEGKPITNFTPNNNGKCEFYEA